MHQNDPRPNAGMCVAFFIISVTGAVVFFTAADWPVGLLFVGLALIYLSSHRAELLDRRDAPAVARSREERRSSGCPGWMPRL